MARALSATEYINLTHNADQFGMSTISWACYVRRTGTTGSNGGYFWGKPRGTNTGTWTSGLSSDKFFVRITTTGGGTDEVIGATTAVSPQVWAHLAAIYDGTDCKLYVNGVEYQSSSLPSGSIETDSDSQKDIFLGAMTGSESTRMLEGDVCECAMWNRSISVAELQMAYRHGVLAVPQGLAVYIPVNGNPTTELELVNNRGTVSHTGSPAKAAHPPRLAVVGGRAADFQVFTPVTAAPGGIIPLIMHHRKMLRS